MPHGYNGKILHVNLTSRTWEVEEPDETFYRRYWGGGALATYYLLKHVKPDTDPLSPDNVLVFACSVLTGAPLSGFCRYTVAAKSPLTGAFGEAEAGGYFGPELKFSGFDAIVIRGAADKPVYLWIQDGKVELRDAGSLWGLDNAPTLDAIREEHGDMKIRVASIGPAGENLALMACVINNLAHVNGRCGMGAVMGSKKLKAVACRGSKEPYEYADPQGLAEVNKWHLAAIRSHMPNVNLGKFGTPMHVMAQQGQGIFPTRNWREGIFEGAEDLGVPGYEKIQTGRETCYKCGVACKRKVKINNQMDERYGGAEYETIAAFGSMCGVSDLVAVTKAHERCNAWGIDTISAGCTIAFAMECFEEGILGPDDAEGRSVKFGDAQGMLWLLERMKDGKGIGAVLNQGVERAAAAIGRGAEKYAFTVKGLEPGLHDPRGKTGVGLGFALSPTGADHIECPHDVAFQGEGWRLIAPLGQLSSPVVRETGPEKVSFFKAGQLTWAMNNTLGICNFVVRPIFALTYDKLVEAIKAITGWETSLLELMIGSERSVVMARMFNIREGFSAKDDKLFKRLHQIIPEGPAKDAKIDEEEFGKAIGMYYEMMGWDEIGKPRPGKLHDLGLGWLA